MKSEWRDIKLSDFIEFNPREYLSKGGIAKKISMEKLFPYTRDIHGYEIAPFMGGSKFRNGDTLMSRITPCLENGKIAQVNILDEGEVAFGSTEFIILREKEKISDKNFIYYLTLSSAIRGPAIKSMIGSSGRQRVQHDAIKNIVISVPPFEEQIEIGNILKMMDDKIALNNQINDYLAA